MNEIRIKSRKKKRTHTHKRNIYWPNDKDAARFYSDTLSSKCAIISVSVWRKKYERVMLWWRLNSFLFHFNIVFSANLTESLAIFQMCMLSDLTFSEIFQFRKKNTGKQASHANIYIYICNLCKIPTYLCCINIAFSR